MDARIRELLDRLVSPGSFPNMSCSEGHELHDGIVQELEEQKASFDLRWNSDMRAIKQWQQAHPGNDLVWPDHTDLSVWLMGQLSDLRAVRDTLQAKCAGWQATVSGLIGDLGKALEQHDALVVQCMRSIAVNRPRSGGGAGQMIKPTVGRVVLYYQHGKTQFDANEQPEAATVAYVHSDTMVNLSVVDHNGVQFPAASVFLYQGDGERPASAYAEWMPYQLRQAAKTEALEKNLRDSAV